MTDPEKLIAGWLDGWLDGSLNEAEQAELDEWLKTDDDNMRRFTDAVMFEQQIQSATIAVEEQPAAASFNASVGAATPRVFSRWSIAVFTVPLVAILALVFWPQHPVDKTFATLEQTPRRVMGKAAICRRRTEVGWNRERCGSPRGWLR